MKKILFITLLASTFLIMGYEPAYQYPYLPVFMKRSELEKAVRLESARPLKNPGKIYIYDHWIFINEKYRGFHVIDNSDPSHPVNKAFIQVDGSLDMAIRQNVMYADNAVDLVAIVLDPSMNSITASGRLKNSLPEPSAPNGFWMTRAFERMRPENGIIVRWETNPEY